MKRFLTLCALSLALCLSASASADVINPDEEVCANKAQGDACDLESGASGTCEPGECCRLDYSQGTPPETVCEACLICEAGNSTSNGTSGTSNSTTNTTGGTTDTSGDTTNTTTSDDGDDEDACASVSLSGRAADMTPLLSLVLGLGLLVALRRRR